MTSRLYIGGSKVLVHQISINQQPVSPRIIQDNDKHNEDYHYDYEFGDTNGTEPSQTIKANEEIYFCVSYLLSLKMRLDFATSDC